MLARLELRDAPTNLCDLRLCEIRGNAASEALHNTIGEFGALRS
jgi:hypothetical protein